MESSQQKEIAQFKSKIDSLTEINKILEQNKLSHANEIEIMSRDIESTGELLKEEMYARQSMEEKYQNLESCALKIKDLEVLIEDMSR